MKKPARVSEPIAMPARVLSARRGFASDAELAEALGVSRSNIARWKKGERPSPENADFLLALDVVVTMLSGWLHPRSVPKYLFGINAFLGHRRPIDVLLLGGLAEVIRAIQADKQGAFA
jgi:transcriptional regulator with XRE-family HTH domain